MFKSTKVVAFALVCTSLLLSFSVTRVQAATAMLTASKDNTLINDSTGAVSNGLGSLFAGRTGGMGPGAQRALMAFDVASEVPAGAVITDVQLTLNIQQAGNGSGLDFYALHRVSQDWGEGTSNAFGGGGAPATAGDATWLHTFLDFVGTPTWTNPGGYFEANASAARGIGTSGTETWGSTPELVADVQAWLDDPSSNFGWILIGDESAFASSRRFGSRESNQGPVLAVSYIPEPQSLLLLSLAIATAATRRTKLS